jgi:phosphatidylglycerol---prolipoprotein diacylglyceryl transferase
MMPVLYRITFAPPYVVAYLLALALVAYTVWNGWRTAVGPFDPKAGDYREPSREDRINRARTYFFYGVGLAVLGLWYALPELPFGIKELPFLGKAKGEGIPLHTYGILIGVGFLGAVSISAYLAEREWTGEKGKKMKEQIYDLAFYVFIGGIGGSVLLFNIVNIKEGRLQMGMVFQGGLICAAAVAYWYGKKHDIDFLRLSDIGLPTVSLGSAFGRLGCFSAGCCWGKPRAPGSTLAVQFPGPQVQDLLGTQSGGVASAAYGSMADGRNETRWLIESTGQVVEQAQAGAVRLSDWVSQHGHTVPIHPTQLYESAAQFLLFAFFISLRPFRRFHGQIAGLWLMVYAIERTTVELFRGDGERGTLHGWAAFIPRDAWYNISTSQLGSVFIFSLGAFILVREWRKYAARTKVELPAAAKVASA